MRISKPLLILLSLLVIGILLAACSQNQSTPVVSSVSTPEPRATSLESVKVSPTIIPQTNSADACTLLTKDDVSQVLGNAVLTAESSGLGGVCTYKTTDLGVELTVSTTGGIKAMNTTMTNLGDLALNVPGLGDQAFFNTNSANALFVLKGDGEYLFNISDLNYQPLDPAFVQATEKLLAVQLLSNLH